MSNKYSKHEEQFKNVKKEINLLFFFYFQDYDSSDYSACDNLALCLLQFWILCKYTDFNVY